MVQTDYLSYLQRCRERFGLIFLDPPYAEKHLENALGAIYEFDILLSGGIIVTERPKGKSLDADFAGYTRSRDYGFGMSAVTLFRKE